MISLFHILASLRALVCRIKKAPIARGFGLKEMMLLSAHHRVEAFLRPSLIRLPMAGSNKSPTLGKHRSG